MKIRTLELSVGAFLIAGFLAFAFLAIKVSGLTFSAPEGSYRVYAKFENVSGLAVRARVTVGGVLIGRVTAVRLDPEDYTAVVEMAIDGPVNNLTTDSSAAILTSGLLGEKYIGITTGADDTFLKDGDMINDTQSALVLENLIGKFLSNKLDEQPAE
ncbi:MAG: outer membrane lipid asymmetry maintenance protein MlaD [Gammaproteobacteria bacterium]